MAILKSLPGVEVAIWSSGSILPEYDDLEDKVRPSWKHKTISKYIESKSDTDFFFNLRVGPPYEHDCAELGFFMYIDGCEESDGYLCSRSDLDEDGEWESDVHGVENWDAEGATVKKFRFSKMHTTDDYSGHLTKTQVKMLQRIGLIEVRVYQLFEGRAAKGTQKQLADVIGTVPAKIFRGQAISHSISYGEGEALQEPSSYQKTEYMHGPDHPVGVFRFKYRSRDDLRVELIIPRSPTPEQPTVRIMEEITAKEKLELARIKYDEMKLLRSLTAVRDTAAPVGSQQRCFKDLTTVELDLLAKQKYAEITGNPFIKPESAVIIKEEPGGGNGDAALSGGRKRLFKDIPIADGKFAIDLTSDDESDSSLKFAGKDKLEISGVKEAKKTQQSREEIARARAVPVEREKGKRRESERSLEDQDFSVGRPPQSKEELRISVGPLKSKRARRPPTTRHGSSAANHEAIKTSGRGIAWAAIHWVGRLLVLHRST